MTDASTVSLLGEHPAGMAMLAVLAIVTLVLGGLAWTMARAGVSLRPIAFVAAFFGLIAIPQAAFHLGVALGVIPERDLSWVPAPDRAANAGFVEQEGALAARDGRFENPVAAFGEGFDPDLVVDLRAAGPATPFADAEAAQMAVVPPDGTTILARFRDARAADDAARTYAQMALGVWPDARADGTRTAARPGGDVAKLVVAGRTLLVLTGPDEASLDARLRTSRAVVPQRAAPPSPADTTGDPAADFWLYRPGVLPALAVLMTGLAVVLFFRGVPWASTVEPRAGAPPISRAELRGRLLALNDLEVPFVVSEADDGRVVVSWRFADARWLDLARSHGMRHVHRILLELDEETRTVRPTEQATRFDRAAGGGSAAVRWSTNLGIVFFQRETQRVFGLQLDESGRLEPRLSYSYRFDLQEMKAPLVAAVTRAGWRWRPTLWHGPRWLHWLTR